MSDVIQKRRLIQKHDTEANWAKATNFIPLKGEPIVFDPDGSFTYPRYKIGDGVTNINDLPFVAPQGDFEQSDPAAADYIKNRTHYKELKTFEEYSYISDSENWVNIISSGIPFIEVNKKFELDSAESYQFRLQMYDSLTDDLLADEGLLDLTVTNFTAYMGVEGFEDVIVLYSDDLGQAVFINGLTGCREAVNNSDESLITKSDSSSYQFYVEEMPAEYYYKFTLIGPGFQSSEMIYTKLGEEYIPDELKPRKPIVIDYKSSYSYEGKFLYDTSIDGMSDLCTERVDKTSRYNHQCMLVSGQYHSDKYFPGYYLITAVDTTNQTFTFVNCKNTVSSSSSGGITPTTCTKEYTVSYPDSSTLPKEGMMIGLDVAVEGDDGNKYVPWRWIKDPNGTTLSSYAEYLSFTKPAGMNKLHISAVYRMVSGDLNQTYTFQSPAFIIAPCGIMNLNVESSNKFYEGIDIYGIYQYGSDSGSSGGLNESDISIGGDSLYAVKSEDSILNYGSQQALVYSEVDVLFEDDQISIEAYQAIDPVHYLGLANDTETPQYGSQTEIQQAFVKKSKWTTRFDKFTDNTLGIQIHTYFLKLQDQQVRLVWEE